ncbi:hypothetical protein Q1695_008381 [Nippostrongylus brasiliensis]|nr:hypothetical protein Q1695_008381 [Nippostrongylus brasiliensis]
MLEGGVRLEWQGLFSIRENCRATLDRGRSTIEQNVPAMVLEETMRLKRRLNHRMQEMFSAQPYSREALGLTKYMAQLDATATPPPCPAPNRTMFTTAAPPTEATIPLNLCTQGTTVNAPGATTSSSTATQSTTTVSGSATTSTVTSGGSQTTSSTSGAPTVSTTSTKVSSTQTATTGASEATTKPTVPVRFADDAASPSISTSSSSSSTASSKSTSSSKASMASSNPTSSSKASAASATHSTSSTPSTTASPSTATPTHCVPAGQKATKKSFQVPYVYHYDTDQDPFYNWMSSIYGYMFKSEEICDQAHITDLNSITEDQFNGFFATLAAVHPGPFCSLCEHFMTELHERVFTMHPMWEEDERHLMRLLYANIPSTKAFCSAVAPACYEEYEAQSKNISDAVVCLECTACMTVTNVIQHGFLLDPTVVANVLSFLRSSLFHNTCAELCLVWQPLNLTLFPNGFTYDGCMNYLTDIYPNVIAIATEILRPERFCSLELKWCELNETPNILHCLRELCVESLGATPQAEWLCALIPDTPAVADQFLNVQTTKRYKSRKPYHDKYELRSAEHDEL